MSTRDAELLRLIEDAINQLRPRYGDLYDEERRWDALTNALESLVVARRLIRDDGKETNR